MLPKQMIVEIMLGKMCPIIMTWLPCSDVGLHGSLPLLFPRQSKGHGYAISVPKYTRKQPAIAVFQEK